jgi:hypothetical protein
VTAQLRNSHPSLRNECVHVCVCIVRLGKLCGCGTIPTFEKVSKTSHISDWHDEKKNPHRLTAHNKLARMTASRRHFHFPLFDLFLPKRGERKWKGINSTTAFSRWFVLFFPTEHVKAIKFQQQVIYNKVEEKCLKSLWLARGVIFLLDPYHVLYCIVLASKKKSLLSFPDGPRSVPVVRWEVVVGSS